MYLKSIEVQGFKSFANKMVFEFHNGITCIVGPNGSGKSNVADAVRWVLGEQSAKQLRGSNMQDVIFSGTEARKPQGFAHVAITLDNSDHKLNIDYDEVTVSRKVFRSGESEYKINGVNCRLRDIYELFYDTGIGKEGYSIIGQGQIERILSNKPEERRELFDEAVGIVKYKHRKQTTLKKLEDEHANLVRVSDILSELEKQVGPLQRQSETAKKYLKLREELKQYDLQMFAIDSVHSEKKLAELKETEAIVSGDLEDAKKSLDTLKASYEEVDTFIRELEQTTQETNEQINQLIETKSDYEGQALVLREQIHTERTNETHINERLSQIREELERFEADKRVFFQQKEELLLALHMQTDKEKALNEQLKALDDSIAEHMAFVERDKSAQMRLLNDRSDVVAKLQHYETLCQQVMLRRKEVSSRLLHLKSEQEGAQKSKQDLLKQQSHVHASIQKLRGEFNGLKDQQKEIHEEQEKLLSQKTKLQEQYHMVHSKATSLKNLEEHFEGYQNSIRRVMEYKNTLGTQGRAIEGVISDLITVDKKYEQAMEIALGGAIQNIVTSTTDMAKQCIAYLKKNQYGRATFLPLDAMKTKTGSFFQPEVLKEEGVIGIASELITFDPRYAGVFDHLLGRVLIVDHMDHATAAAKKYHYSLRMVTLDGDLIAPGGSMTGGAYKNNSNLLGRKREITEAEEQAVLLRKEMADLDKKLEKVSRRLEECLRSGQDISAKLQQVALQDTTISMSIAQCDEKLENARIAIGDVSGETAQIEKELAEISESKKKIEEEISTIEKQKDHRVEDVDKWSKQLFKERTLREEKAEEAALLKLELAKQKQSLEFIEENAERIRRDGERMMYEAENLMQRLADIEKTISDREKEIQELAQKTESIVACLEEGKAKLQLLNDKRQRIMTEQKDFFIKQQEISDRVRELEMESLRLDSQKEKLEEHLHEQTNYLYMEYEMTPSEVGAPKENLTTNVSELKKEIVHYKTEIKSLGHVNVGAIEEYKEVAGRYEFMKGQYEDLTKAEAALQGIIDELDDGMRRQFTEQFAKIQVEFDRVFKELFGGGHARLELVEGEDVIEAGIRIISQPPGKKLQNMMQLSGGEKALTAISLLFAIQSLKPSPFCLLDEIEAALDDSNVSRFAGYLHKLTDETQFILISHRRGTMVMADRLYGITMQEKGVSTLVSVNLIEKELEN